MRVKRVIQLITNVHRIHYSDYSYGWKISFIPIGLFTVPLWNRGGYVKFNKRLHIINRNDYHNCTLTGRY